MVCKNKKGCQHPSYPLSCLHTHSLLFILQHKTAMLSCTAQVTKEVSSAGNGGRGQPGQAVWLWVGRTKLLADDQAADQLQDEPGAFSVMYSMLSLFKCCSQRNRRCFLGFLSRVSQPAALCGILEGRVLCCDGGLSDALCRAMGLQTDFFLPKKTFIHHLQGFCWSRTQLDCSVVQDIKPTL